MWEGESGAAMKDNEGSLAVFRDELAHAHHLDWVAMAVFTLVSVFSGVVLVLSEVLKVQTTGEFALLPLFATALAAAGAHSLVTNAGDYWISCVVATRSLQAAGLVEKGVFPESLVAYPPQAAIQFARRLVLGARGAFLVLYLLLGWASSYSFFHQYLGLFPSIVAGAVVPMCFAISSTIVTSEHLRHLFTALVQEGELALGTQEDLAERHCSVADALVLLDPPRTREALSHYQVALSLNPASRRAEEGAHRIKALQRRIP